MSDLQKIIEDKLKNNRTWVDDLGPDIGPSEFMIYLIDYDE